MRISNETKVGALTVIAVTIIVLGFNFLRGKTIFKSGNFIYAKYHDTKGLIVSNPVYVNGYQVGTVFEIENLNANLSEISVAIKMNNNYQIPVNSIATIQENPLGTNSIYITLGTAADYLKNGDTVRTAPATSLLGDFMNTLSPMGEQFKKTIDELRKVLVYVNTVMDEENKAATKKAIMRNMDKLKLYYRIDDIYKNEEKFDNFLKEFVIMMPGLNKIMNELDDIFKDIEVDEDIVSNFRSNCISSESMLLGKKRSAPESELSQVETPKKKTVVENVVQKQDFTFRNVKEKINKINLNGITLSSSKSTTNSNTPEQNTNLSLPNISQELKKIDLYKINPMPMYSKTNEKQHLTRGINSKLAGSIKSKPTKLTHKKNKEKSVKSVIHNSFFERFRIQNKTDENSQHNITYLKTTPKEDPKPKPEEKKTKPEKKFKISVTKDPTTNHTYVHFSKQSNEEQESDDEILAENTPTKSSYKRSPMTVSRTNLLKLFNQSNKI